MVHFAGIQLSVLELSLFTSVLFLIGFSVLAFRRIAQLELRLQQVKITTTRELKMVNQGAIGIGRRCAALEKNLKKPANVANFDAIKEAKMAASAFEQVAKTVRQEPVAQPVKTETRASGLSTRAEKALSAWINENQTA